MSCKGQGGWGTVTGVGGWGGVSSGLVQPVGSLGGLARVYVHGLLAVFALDSAAPFELALAFGDPLHPSGVVSSPAAHDLAAVGAA